MVRARILRRALTIAVVGGALATPATAPAADELYTVAGTGRIGPLGDGGPATAAAVSGGASVAALPGGGFALGERGRVRLIDRAGRIRTLAGTGHPGHAGDGGPALSATVDPSAIVVAADGSLLVAQCEAVPGTGELSRTVGRVRRIAPDGTIATVAGGRSPPPDGIGDGGPAIAAGLNCPTGVEAAPDGGFLIADSSCVRLTGPLPDSRLLPWG
jgi:hypothetical protein